MMGGTTAYEYGYAFDGGRRWKKDIANAVWTWFPCGVACSAGDLVEQTSDLTGQSWSTSALYLRGMGCGSSIYRRNSEWHLFDAGGTAGVITDGSANVLSNNLYDAFGVLMYVSGSAATQWRFEGRFVEEEGLVASAGGGGDMLVARGVALAGKPKPPADKNPECAKLAKDYPTEGWHICTDHYWLGYCAGYCKAKGHPLVVACCCTAPLKGVIHIHISCAGGGPPIDI
ncbi:MAG: hypothetical protein KGJ62_13160 [Armatimonadetes bacterium]|nr:hypothetical protein [Armatimonadota bacterium]MDE2206126.1 hypothetical protein [Armatimonadota bacterium]